MSQTYSINIGQITEAQKLQNLQDVFIGLPDNTSKLIAPMDVRNAIYTTWENISLKTTKVANSNILYTGYDINTIRQKLFFGKKRNYNMDIMSDTLLSSDSDYYFYNNKEDLDGNQNTKIVFLSGTTSAAWSANNVVIAPYIEAVTSNNPSLAVDLYIHNTGYSAFNAGRISIDAHQVLIKGVKYPVPPSTQGKFLSCDSAGNASWEDMTANSISSSGVVNIIGSPVLINGNEMEYTNLYPSQVAVGGVPVGSTFSNVPIVDLFNMIFYPYLVPVVLLSVSKDVYEQGQVYSPQLYWTLQARTNAIVNASIVNANPTTLTPSPNPMTIISGTANSSIMNSASATVSWTLSAFDGLDTVSVSVVAKKVFPFFYGMKSNLITSGTIIYTDLTKVTEDKSKKTFTYTGNNSYMYFAYPVSYGLLSTIKDQNLYTVFSGGSGSFTYSTLTVNCSAWSEQYYVYRTNTITSNYGYPFIFEF